jgi:ABC-type dipeptide/oligopeptide/nickel transport system ATPase component
MENLLQVRGLKVDFNLKGQQVCAVDGVNFDIRDNEILVLAGESGSGKSVSALALTRILPSGAKISSGHAHYQGKDLLKLDESALENIRGREIAYIFQEPWSFLNPVYSVGVQIMETLTLRCPLPKKKAKETAISLLNDVRINDPERVFFSYPHQLSGGMNQRVFIAMSLASNPRILIADEPTTALDVIIEAQILELLSDLRKRLRFSLLFITHNLSIAKKIADRVCIMHKGRIVEEARTEELFSSPQHFHTQELLAAYEKIGKL